MFRKIKIHWKLFYLRLQIEGLEEELEDYNPWITYEEEINYNKCYD